MGEDNHSFLPRILPIRDSDGATIGAAVLLEDITRFRLLDEVKSNLVATVSHELKTPLTSIRLVLHLLLEETIGPLAPKQLELLVDARDNAERLLVMINNLLDLARLEQGTEPTPSATRTADWPCCSPRPSPFNRGLRIEASSCRWMWPATCPPVAVDADQFQHALQNLLDNALVHTPQGGRITLSAHSADGRVVFSVADTGCGIPAQYLPMVFERYFRVPGRHDPRRQRTRAGHCARDCHGPRRHGGVRKPARGDDRVSHDAAGLGPQERREDAVSKTTARDELTESRPTRVPTVSTDELQPKPELFLDLIRRQQRGRLKIYLGFAAGVGKTYDMLQEGNRLRRQGVDVVIGYVEPHGRAETIAQIGELEQVPRRRIEYRGIVLEEMDCGCGAPAAAHHCAGG